MNYYAPKSILIIFGGRNDLNPDANGSVCLNDVWILTLECLKWVKWDTKEAPEARYSHCSTVVNGAIMIFGGLGENNYCKSRLHSMDIESIGLKFGRLSGKLGIQDQGIDYDEKNESNDLVSFSQIGRAHV